MASSIADDENYELVDYTAASSWEKFIAAIGDILHNWGVNDGGLGGFCTDEVQQKCQQLIVRHRQDRSSVLAQISKLCTREEQISFRGTAYALTLSAHPLMFQHESSKSARLDSLFPAVYATELEADRGSHSEPEPAWHPLHRWTGSRLIIYLRYIGDGSDWADDTLDADAGSVDTSSNYSVSLETAKLLMSSMNIAVQNTRCQVPVFVPVGDAWRYLFTGRSLGRALADERVNDKETRTAVAAEKKFESVYLAQAPSAYLQLNGLLELYSNSFRILAQAPFAQSGTSKDTAVAESALAQEWEYISKTVSLAALHVYKIKNTYSRDWNTTSADFQYRAGDLNVGPATDPLRTITLSSFFQPLPCGAYIDPQPTGRDKLYLKTATAWSLSVQLLPADMERTMLTEALEDAFAAWAQSSDQANRHRHLRMSEQMEAHAEITSDMLIDLFGASSYSSIVPPGLSKDKTEEDQSRAFTERLEKTMADVYPGTDPIARPPTTEQLIARMPHGTAVPYRSLLWRLSEIILVTTAKRSADFWRAPSIMTFLRLLWAMALKEIRWRWENGVLLPKIASEAEYRTLQEGIASGSETPDLPKTPLQAASSGQGMTSSIYTIHLKSLLAYQKLEMLNCCQERKLLRRNAVSHTGDAAPHIKAGNSAIPTIPDSCSAAEHLMQDVLDSPSAGSSSLVDRIRSHVHDQIRKGKEASSNDSGHGPWSSGSHIRRPIGRLLKSIRSQDSRPTQATLSAGDAEEFEDIKGDLEASDSDGFVSAAEVDDGSAYANENCNEEASNDCNESIAGGSKQCNDAQSIACIDDDTTSTFSLYRDNSSSIDDRATLSSFASVRLPPNAAGSTSDVDISGKPIAIPGQSNRESNYIDLTLSLSLDSNSGFHHISDVHEREQPSVMSGGASSPASSAVPAHIPRTSAHKGSGSDGSTDGAEAGSSNECMGRLFPSDHLTLLGTDIPLWIPKIQLPPILTEDMLREKEAILIGFGTSTEGAKQRAELQCAELISDMESFKAANPNCVLADFVRWHSPRDWIVPEGGEEKNGSLSVRMSEGEENLWQQLWAGAKPVPADKQKLLFDYELEAEKALHYLEGIPIYTLFTGLLPT
ncbi:hypothetical protein GGI12_003134, partial [Dipsacomyces acuminosporus]